MYYDKDMNVVVEPIKRGDNMIDISNMTEKEIALKIAKNFGMEYEVIEWQKIYLDSGVKEELSWAYALHEWDIYPYTKKQLIEFLNRKG